MTGGIHPGPQDHLIDIAGIRVGHAEDEVARTGVTVILPDRPAVMAVDVRGGGPGTRETDALDPSCLITHFHGLVLAGGSVFGLDAAGAVAAWLSARGVGLELGARAVPVVPAAILFDLGNGGDKDWGEAPPYRDLAVAACQAAGADDRIGPIGAGHGARAGSRPGGIGAASLIDPARGVRVAALMAVNCFGEVMDGPPGADVPLPKAGQLGGNTSIGVVATDARLDKAAAKRLAMMAQDGLARAIRPIHTPFDGDSVFAMATGTAAGDVSALDLAVIGTLAADCVCRAVQRAVGQLG
ncbi:MAG: P1 family peptidase [Sphingomonadales bacterium]